MLSSRFVFLPNNRATLGRIKALYAEMVSRGWDCHVILGCSAWDSNEFDTPYRIQTMYAGDDQENMALTTASYITQLVSYLRTLRPDYAVIHGDRYEQLGAALACAYMNIPIIHTEGGDWSGSIDNKVRWAISSLAHLHFPSNEEAYYELLNLTNPRNTFMVGSTGIDLVREWQENHKYVTHDSPYVLVLHHPDTVNPEDITPLIRAILNVCGAYRIVWVNANVDAGAREMMKEVHKYDVEFTKNLPPYDFFSLMQGASVLVGNSSSFIKEAAYMGKRAVIVGERQKNRAHGRNVVFVPQLQDRIEKALLNALADGDCEPDYVFGDGHACEKICDVLEEM